MLARPCFGMDIEPQRGIGEKGDPNEEGWLERLFLGKEIVTSISRAIGTSM